MTTGKSEERTKWEVSMFFFSSYGLELLFYIRAMVTAFAD